MPGKRRRSYLLAFEKAGSLRTAKAKSIYTRHYPMSLDYCKDQSHTFFFAKTRLRFIYGEKNHTHIKEKTIDLERRRRDHIRKLREFEISNTLLELAGAEQRNFYSLTSGLIFFDCSLFLFFFFSFLFLLPYSSFVFFFPIVFILSVHLYRLQGHTLFSPLP